MVKCFCDLCGKEVSQLTPVKVASEVLVGALYRVKELELCEDCSAYVKEYLNQFDNAVVRARVEFSKLLIPNLEEL